VPAVILQPLLVNLVHIERRVRHHKIKLGRAGVHILVITVALPDIPVQPMHRQIHAAQSHRLGHLLLPINADARLTAPPAAHKLRRLHKHTARPAGRVQNQPVKRLNNLHNQPHNRIGGKELAPALALGQRKITQKILVNPPKGIAFHIHRNAVENLEQLPQNAILQAVVGLGQHIAQILILLFHRPHGIIDRLAQVGAFGQVQQR